MSREMFVFGSNLAGRHGAGAALYALKHYGAIYGQSYGPQGDSFAIPTKDSDLNPLSLRDINVYVDAFVMFANMHPEIDFLVTTIGCGLAGYGDDEIAPMFLSSPLNCKFHPRWMPYLGSTYSYIPSWGSGVYERQ